MIKIDNNYAIEADTECWTLNYEKTGEINEKTGSPTITRNKWYHGSLRQALKQYVDEALKPSTGARDLLARIVALEKKIDDTLIQYAEQEKQAAVPVFEDLVTIEVSADVMQFIRDGYYCCVQDSKGGCLEAYSGDGKNWAMYVVKNNDLGEAPIGYPIITNDGGKTWEEIRSEENPSNETTILGITFVDISKEGKDGK